MNLDWSLITSVLGGTFTGNLASKLLGDWYAGRQRRSETFSQRVHEHRAELRRAYAELIGAVDRLIRLGRELDGALEAYETKRHDVEELGERISEVREEYDALVASTDADETHQSERASNLHRNLDAMEDEADRMRPVVDRLGVTIRNLEKGYDEATQAFQVERVNLHLTDNDPERSDALYQLTDIDIGPPELSTRERIARFTSALRERRAQLMTAIEGAFAPKKP